MTQAIRQDIIALVNQLPDECLSEVLEVLRSLSPEIEDTKPDEATPSSEADFDVAMSAYQVISQKYRKALRELA
ncbi:hypothetical protein [Roseofilum capinflatum]|uniref:Uncharacterized protein n=1 Tax=Roseofilum capinflatum BLCC-M114 TaxID=3022440 RepID=A0ABT7BA58_9CYAN|nr:hypothetical protein [Roseofilum capinflatum]MDJ1175178.1 hypothetical protein [Roseofilum capinflatum BLCC-M114]